MKKNFIYIIILVLVVFGAIQLFNRNNTGSDSNIESPEKVTIAMVTFPGYAPLYLAQEKNLFPESIEVELVRIESVPELRAAMRSGSIDMYAATYDMFQSTGEITPPGIGFMAIDKSHGADGIVAVDGIETIADLRGKTVAAEPGYPPYFVLQYLLNEEGMTLDDVDFKDLSSADAGNAFVSGAVDIAATYEPYLSISKDKVENSKMFASTADVPVFIGDFLFAQEDLVNNNPQILKAVAQGWFNAVESINSDPEAYEIMGQAFGVSAEEMKDFETGVSWLSLSDNKELFDINNENNAYKTFDLVGDILEANNEAGVRVKGTDAISNIIINQL